MTNLLVSLSKLKELEIGSFYKISDEELSKLLKQDLYKIDLSSDWESTLDGLLRDSSISTEEYQEMKSNIHGLRIAKLIQILREKGELDPIEIKEDPTAYSLITDGHHRLRAYEFVGSFKVSCIIIGSPDFIANFRE